MAGGKVKCVNIDNNCFSLALLIFAIDYLPGGLSPFIISISLLLKIAKNEIKISGISSLYSYLNYSDSLQVVKFKHIAITQTNWAPCIVNEIPHIEIKFNTVTEF